MFCKFCGENIEDNSVFCSKCGAKLNAEDETEKIIEKDVDSSEISIEKKPSRFLSIMQKIIFGCIITGIVGATSFLVTILVGLIGYGEVYLFDGYYFTKVLTIINIVLMLIGASAVIVKCVLNLAFKIGNFPKTIIKRILVISLAVICVGFSVWGFIDCSNTAYDYYDDDYSSGGSYSGGYETTVSKYIGLSLSVTEIETSGSYVYVYCSIKNVSRSYGTATKYRYVKVKATFKDRYGSVLDTDWTYAVDSSWLNPGETKTFYYMVRNTSVKSATLSIIE